MIELAQRGDLGIDVREGRIGDGIMGPALFGGDQVENLGQVVERRQRALVKSDGGSAVGKGAISSAAL